MISSTHSAQILTDPRSCDTHISLSCTSPLLHAVSYSGCCSRLPVKFGPLACDRISTFPECFFRQNCRERAACNIPTQQPGIGLACLKILSECSVIACSKELWAISILAAPSPPALWCRVVKLSASPYQVSDVSVVRQASKANVGWSTIFVVKLISFRVFVCVCDGSGGGGEEKCYWGYYGDSISEHLHTYTQTHASLRRLTHPDSLARTKKQIFLRGIPSVVEAASGFTNWSERGLGERVPRWGSLLTYASSQICWARKLHKTMLISGILSVLWGAGGGSQTGNQ